MEIRHGTYRYGYLRGCRSQCCKRAYNRWSSYRYNKRREAGYIAEWQPVEEVSERILLLTDTYNYTLRSLADETGFSIDTLRRWAFQKTKHAKKEKAQALFDIPLKHYLKGRTERSMVPAAGAIRRVQDMYRRGFTVAHMRRLSNVNLKLLHDLRRGLVDKVEVSTHKKIAKLMDNVLYLPEPQGSHADLARRTAEQEGYIPLGRWEHIDDPNCEPDFIPVEKVDGVIMDPNLAEAIHRVRALAVRGFLVKDIAHQAGINKSSFAKIIYGDRVNTKAENIKKMNAASDYFEPLPDPEGPLARKTRTLALNRGWDKETARID